MFCTKCGNEVSSGTRFCPKCGKELSSSTSNTSTATGTRDQVNKDDLIFPKEKVPSKWIAAWSLLLPGVPQFILGQTPKGFMILGFSILCAFIPNLYPWGSLAVSIMSIMNACKAIDTLRSGKPITKWNDVPPPGYNK